MQYLYVIISQISVSKLREHRKHHNDILDYGFFLFLWPIKVCKNGKNTPIINVINGRHNGLRLHRKNRI